MKNNINRNKGAVSIILTIIIMNMLLVISSGIAILIFQQTEGSIESGLSVVAFYAAESGIERCLYDVRINKLSSCPYANVPLDTYPDAVYTTDFNGSDEINSIGQYKKASRKIEVFW